MLHLKFVFIFLHHHLNITSQLYMKSFHYRIPLVLILSTGIFYVPRLQAQEKVTPDSLKKINLPTAIVTGSKSSKGNVSELSRKDLDILQAKTLGETLSRVPGVQNANFGPNSGAPMIRSMSGNRVKILSNGLSYNDLSGISPNLNSNVDMDNLLGIDVYKGSASVLYGGKAIGGAVDMHDNTIPVTLFAQSFGGRVTVRRWYE